ncbi:MAG: low temperature requirement protein A [Hamadaea sp.]|nr:low temperature requirement protein A [Hamadaea sp.]
MTQANAEPHRKVTWAELFFDLVFVFAVTEVSGLLHHDHTATGVLRALILFVPLFWTWVGTTMHSNHHRVEGPGDRLAMFTVALASLFMALAVPAAYEDRGLLFGGAYLLIRIVLGLGMFRHGWFFFNSFTLGVFVTGPLFVVGGLVHDAWRPALWALAGALDLAGPWLARRRLDDRVFDVNHLPERFGLLVIVALGESIVAIGAQAAGSVDLDATVLVAVGAAFALTAGLWWVYFHFAADAIAQALEAATAKGTIIRPVLTYGHFIFISGVIAVAVGLAEGVAHPGERLSASVAALLFGGCVVYLGGFAFTRWIMFRTVAKSRLTAAAAVVVLAPVALAVPAVVSLLSLAAVVALLNLFEYAYVRRSGQPIHRRPVPQQTKPRDGADDGVALADDTV